MADDTDTEDLDVDLDGIDEYDGEDGDDLSIEAAKDSGTRERDGVQALQDVEAEQGDESEVDDGFALDTEEAREAGVALDPVGELGDEPRLD